VAVVTSAKSPLALMLVMLTEALLMELSVTIRSGLVVFPGTVPKLRLVGKSVTAGGVETWATKAPPGLAWSGSTVGKSVEVVVPATSALSEESMAMPSAWSSPFPPR
jgi:hypothetical protein